MAKEYDLVIIGGVQGDMLLPSALHSWVSKRHLWKKTGSAAHVCIKVAFRVKRCFAPQKYMQQLNEVRTLA